MAVQNIWRQEAKKKELQTPDGKRKQADKNFKKAILWPVATVILLALYTVYVVNGTIALDFATIALLVIMVLFFLYSVPQIKVAKDEREKVYKETGKEIFKAKKSKKK